MSDSILSALSDELDVPPQQAKKLLIAMLREVRKRARREGVRLPEFGTFRESQGRITFEPSPSLARAVNHRFEGLQSEDLDTAPDTEEEAQKDDGGPSTITLGYQDSDWSPLDDDGDDTADGDQDEEEPDTEEFEVPSAEEAVDTDEEEPPDTVSPSAVPAESDSTEKSGDQETSDTEELYPFVEDVPDGEEEAAKAEAERSQPEASGQQRPADEEHDSLSSIWSSEETEEEESSSFPDEDFDLPGSDSASGPDSSPEPKPASSAEPSATPDPPTSDAELDPDVRESVSKPEEETPDDGGSTGVRVLTGVLVVLLLGAAGWYVLGQRGTVQPPRETIAQLKSQLSSQDIPLVGTTSQGSSATSDAGSSPDPQSTTGASQDASVSSSTSETDTSPSQSAEQDRGTTETGSAEDITPAEGGWTIVVGSRTERAAAQSLADKYRSVFADQNLPVDVIPGTVENSTRYRVGVGQFGSRSDVQNFLETADQQLPEGAWPLSL